VHGRRGRRGRRRAWRAAHGRAAMPRRAARRPGGDATRARREGARPSQAGPAAGSTVGRAMTARRVVSAMRRAGRRRGTWRWDGSAPARPGSVPPPRVVDRFDVPQPYERLERRDGPRLAARAADGVRRRCGDKVRGRGALAPRVPGVRLTAGSPRELTAGRTCLGAIRCLRRAAARYGRRVAAGPRPRGRGLPGRGRRASRRAGRG
jgi:hypothetical protein